MRPIYEITADGNATRLSGKVRALEIADSKGDESDTLTLEVSDDGSLAIPRKGAVLSVRLGYVETGLVDKGQFIVDEVELSHGLMQITARATGFRQGSPIKAPRQRSWHDTTIGDIVATIAKENNLEPACEASLAARAVPHLDQTVSDLQMLTDLAYQNGALSKPAAGRLLFVPLGQAKSVSGKDMPSMTITPADVEPGWRVTLADRSSYTGVRTHWHEVEGAELHDELLGDATGQVLDVAMPYPSQAEAQRAGRAKLAMLQRGGGKFTCSMNGRPELAAETRLTLVGFRDGVDGDWITESVNHKVSSGYKCSVTAEPEL